MILAYQQDFFSKAFICLGGILSFLLILKIKIAEHFKNFFKVSAFSNFEFNLQDGFLTFAGF